MNYDLTEYLVIALVPGWESLGGGLNAMRFRAASPEEAVTSRVRPLLPQIPKYPWRFIVVDLVTTESTLIEWTPPTPATTKRVAL